MERLFIGGPYHQQRIDVGNVGSCLGYDVCEGQVVETAYHRVVLREGKREAVVFVADGADHDLNYRTLSEWIEWAIGATHA